MSKDTGNKDILDIFILKHCLRPKKRAEIMSALELANRQDNYDRYISPLVDKNWISFTIPDFKTHQNQQYKTTSDGEKALAQLSAL